jgi:hypothetical protein
MIDNVPNESTCQIFVAVINIRQTNLHAKSNLYKTNLHAK